MKICSVDGCPNNVYCKGVCIRHYRHLQRYGHVKERTRMDKNEIVVHENYAEIILYNRECEEVARAKISLESIPIAKQYKWCLQGDGYVVAGSDRNVILHRLLMGNPKGLVVDHKYRDKLDNRLHMLRVATQQQNCFNRSSRSKTGCKGVYLTKSGKYLVTITKDGKFIYLGTYFSKSFAKRVRARAERKYFGEFRELGR